MKPIKFKEATKVLQKPSTMTDAECASLHVWTDGKECVSCWKPTIKERVRILFGGKIYLGVLSGCSTQPPVFVTGEYPFNRPSFFVRVGNFFASVGNCATRFAKAVRMGAKQADKRKHFVGGLLISLLIGLCNPYCGLVAGIVAAALKEWWDSKGHGTVEFMDFFFSSIGALCAFPVAYFIHSFIW